MGRWLGALVLIGACVCWVASVHAAQGGGGHGAGGGGHGAGGADQGGGGADQPGGPGGLAGLVPPPPQAVLEFIMQHAADLKLTDEQKAKLAELKKTLPQTPPKPPMNDPEMKELFKKMREAMKSGDKDQAQELRKQMAEKLKQANPEGQKVMDAIKAILSPEQAAQMKELWKQQGPRGGGRGQGGEGGKGEKRGGGQPGQGEKRGGGGGGPPPLDW